MTAATTPPAPLNPSFDECSCSLAVTWRGKGDDNGKGKGRESFARLYHDWLLGIDGDDSLGCVRQILSDLSGGGIEWALLGESFETFFAQHHWRNQPEGYFLGNELEVLSQRIDREYEEWERKHVSA